MEYFKDVSEFWYDRCKASSAKTLEFTTSATEFSLEYKINGLGQRILLNFLLMD